jgi:hypothetical protein
VVALLASLPLQATAADWPTYHRSNARDGNDTAGAAFNSIGQQWISPSLDGDIYGSPLVVGNQVIVATENDSIYSLDATTGAPTWSAPANFGTPVTVSGNSLFSPCGNISPDGITGTPVADPVAGVVYAVAFVHGATDQYELVAVNLSDGTRRFNPIPIDPAGFNVYREQQRGALALANGMVYIPFGGYVGDCPVYHGYVIGIKADGSSTALTVFEDQPQPPCAGTTADEAGIWGASGPAVDGSGNLYVATGNGSDEVDYDCGETVFKLNPNLGYVDSWAPAAWSALNHLDTDVGSIGPAVVGSAGNLIFQSGKNGWGYLLDAGALSSNSNHIGGEAYAAAVCSAALVSPNDPTYAFDQVFGGVAYADPYVYVPCPEGIKALRLGAGPSFSAAWSSPSFHPAAPVVSGGVLWAVDTNAGVLYGLDPSTGASLFTAGLGAQTHFSTPAAGLGRIFVADGAGPDDVRAFGQGGGRYHPLAPFRIYDSRNGAGSLGPGATRDVQVTGVAGSGVPSSGVAAAVINVTVDRTTSQSFLTVYPAASQRPPTSTLNWTARKTIANLTEVAIGAGGRITVFNAAGFTDVILDVEGWVGVPGAAAPDGLLNPLLPQRILDTRNAIGVPASAPIPAGGSIDVQVTSRGGVPSSGVEAVVLNLTATDATTQSYLTAYPTGSARPATSNVNFYPNTSVPNRVMVRLGTGGRVTIYNPAGSVDAVGDVNGWFTDTTVGGAGASFAGVEPSRILDTRGVNGQPVGAPVAPLGQGQTISLQVAGVAGVPSMSASTPPAAVVLNVTVTQPTAPNSIIIAWPAGMARNNTSDLNFVAGQTVANLVVVQVGSNGKVNLYNALGSVQVIADVMGWYG